MNNDFPELEYQGDGRSLRLGSPDEVISKADGIPMPPKDCELIEFNEPMIDPDTGTSEIEAHKYEYLDAMYLYLPKSIKKIGDYAFLGCTKLKDIVLPDEVEFIGEGAFMHCASVENIAIPDGVKSILPYTFAGMRSLDLLSFTNSVKEIHLSAFLACEKLEFIVFYGSEKDWKKINFIGDKEIFKGIYITCAADSTDKYGFDVWESKMKNYLEETENLSLSSILDGTRQKKSDALMAELDDILKRIFEDN